MKKILILITLLACLNSYCQTFSLLEINAKWNSKNSLPVNEIAGIKIGFAWLEDQPIQIQKSVKAVPTLVLMENGRPIHQWQAGIDLKLKVTEEEVKKVLNKVKNEINRKL